MATESEPLVRSSFSFSSGSPFAQPTTIVWEASAVQVVDDATAVMDAALQGGEGTGGDGGGVGAAGEGGGGGEAAGTSLASMLMAAPMSLATTAPSAGSPYIGSASQPSSAVVTLGGAGPARSGAPSATPLLPRGLQTTQSGVSRPGRPAVAQGRRLHLSEVVIPPLPPPQATSRAHARALSTSLTAPHHSSPAHTHPPSHPPAPTQPHPTTFPPAHLPTLPRSTTRRGTSACGPARSAGCSRRGGAAATPRSRSACTAPR